MVKGKPQGAGVRGIHSKSVKKFPPSDEFKLFVHKMWEKLFVRSLARQPTHGFKINNIQATYIGPRIRVAVTQLSSIPGL